jgi:hypothetical protein
MWFDRSLSLGLGRELGAGVVQILAGVARLDLVEGRLDEARNHLDTALRAAEQSGSRVEYPFLAVAYAAMAAARGDADAARALFEIGLSHGRRSGSALQPMVDAELAPLYMSTVGEQPAGVDKARALATPLEDIPMVIRQLIEF